MSNNDICYLVDSSSNIFNLEKDNIFDISSKVFIKNNDDNKYKIIDNLKEKNIPTSKIDFFDNFSSGDYIYKIDLLLKKYKKIIFLVGSNLFINSLEKISEIKYLFKNDSLWVIKTNLFDISIFWLIENIKQNKFENEHDLQKYTINFQNKILDIIFTQNKISNQNLKNKLIQNLSKNITDNLTSTNVIYNLKSQNFINKKKKYFNSKIAFAKTIKVINNKCKNNKIIKINLYSNFLNKKIEYKFKNLLMNKFNLLEIFQNESSQILKKFFNRNIIVILIEFDNNII